jgi:SAM-dependent methyltransferase
VSKSQGANSNLVEIWNGEYSSSQVIPSSLRSAPSKALVQYGELIEFRDWSPVLDVGCGNGRNAIYLAGKGCLVEAVDASPSALALLSARAREAGVLQNIRIRNEVLGKKWPIPDGAFSLTLDSYVSCHLLEDEVCDAFRHELRRVTRSGGLVYTAGFATDDEYYAGFLSGESVRIVIDPNNGVAKRLYTRQEYFDSFSNEFDVVFETNFRFYDTVLGRRYRRSILTLILEVR